MYILSYVQTSGLCAQKNGLKETFLLSTHNVYFGCCHLQTTKVATSKERVIM